MKGKKLGKLHRTRKLSHKERKDLPGHTGYISRTQVTKRVQLSLTNFRRMCIYKGIHPVQPGLKRLRKNKGKTWYYLKDINFMNRDEIVQWFRDIKIYKKRKAYLKGVHRPLELQELKKRKPQLNMDHFVKERYPTFQDALADLDDAVSLIYLFSEMQYGVTNRILKRSQARECIRLKNEWQTYLAESNSLRKVFVSIKGIYYQAEVLGNVVTWLTPHPQKINVPQNVDVVVMCFFCDFYISMLNFVLYRLYTDAGLHYPPKIDAVLAGQDEGIKAVSLERFVAAPIKKEEALPAVPKPAPLTSAEKERVAIVNKKLKQIIAHDDAAAKKEESDLVEVKAEPTEEEEYPEEFKKVDAEENAEAGLPQARNSATLFKGFKFLINREIPKPEIRFMVRAFAGEDFTEYDGVENDPKITHHIVDRQWDKSKMMIGREYIQPQWIFDSINAGILLPYHEYPKYIRRASEYHLKLLRYAPDAQLPPHISPFVNDVKRGYVPKQREHLDELIAKEKGEGGKGVKDEGSDDELLIGADDEDEDQTSLEAMYMKELEAEQGGKSYASYVEDELGVTKLVGEDEEDEEVTKALKNKKTKKQAMEEKQKQDDEEREAMTIDLLSHKHRRLVHSIKNANEKAAQKTQKLLEKRVAAEKRQKEEEKEKKLALPSEPADLKRKAEAPTQDKKTKKMKK